mgnify:CR=1 FL=1
MDVPTFQPSLPCDTSPVPVDDGDLPATTTADSWTGVPGARLTTSSSSGALSGARPKRRSAAVTGR